MTAAVRGHVKPLDWIDPVHALSAFAGETGTLLLSGGPDTQSLLFPGPAAPFPIGRAEAQSGGWFDAIGAARDAAAKGDLVAGLFEYEAARTLSWPDWSPDTPPIHLFAYRAWLRFDPLARRVTLEGRATAMRAVEKRLAAVRPLPDARAPSGSFEPVWPKAKYLQSCHAILDHIRAGDIYQTNLSQPFAGRLGEGDTPLDLFRRLTADSPAPHGAYLRLPDGRVVISNSPERFVRLEDGVAQARPIKGTRPRGATPEADAALVRELAESEKDRAENLMIVDLMRNDLSRVCAPGSVEVPELFKVESFANVHHLVSTVTGQLAEGRDGLDLLAAAFPPGSITGAPKLRAMDILSAQEGAPRGAYCGALGWIGDRAQTMDFNVMIRTLTLEEEDGGWAVSGRSGGAITIGSDPEEEYAETMAKASALKKAIAG
ncbi:MAG: aminodeoxychorismate synthase, component I [Maricaulis sp.]|jgi:para-aminobenzoate synthetase component 1|nr:aminodeoxychorismate synthase, component I [Maricaulis sp.]HAQ33842.1 aminodeoxychorismate synthase component I [Alphaproteobacteria bacterium]